MIAKCLLLLALSAVALGSKCEAPKVSTSSFSTTDGFFHFASTFVVQFTIQCSNNVKDMPVFAVVNDKVYQAAVSEETSTYQVSWTLPHAESYARTFDVSIYDEDSIKAFKKAQRDGVETSSIKPLYTHSLVHAGASKAWPITPAAVATVIFIAVSAYVISLKKQYN